MTIKLHCFGESGNAYKVALALELAGLDWQPVFVDFFNGETRTEDWRARVNPMGEVPVLQDGDMTLTQSGAMLDHIARTTGKLDGDRSEILRWLFWDNHKFSTQIGMTRFLMNFLPEAKRPQPVIDFQLGRLKAAYGVLDAQLKGRDWLVGRDVTIADLSCCGYLYYPEPFGFDRADWPEIDRWLNNIQSLPGWKHPYDLMPRAAAA
ncbi:glutathione S-transferase N-terminal domain-containing protein [Maribius pontilimi]|uniref:Glutathione S-transferase N-terminal domain-containing protein n=1 Tax=Palleronia pontilimi TaxID=1964209 RepID=A0A934IHD7_9RHOB|nr:glutathione S-transferase [Palleronia pontilimi]MBJ3762620.1 glutathione S-transferase N-terminal domain-containing protein [Palleronia pontilimi]